MTFNITSIEFELQTLVQIPKLYIVARKSINIPTKNMPEDNQEVISTLENTVRILKVNRPHRKNAYNTNIYKTLADALNADSHNDQVVSTIITASGEFYSSGFDIKDAVNKDANQRGDPTSAVKSLILALINYPKLLISVINGPAIGIGFTSAVLCDVIYASDRAYFRAPFVELGLCAEGCSSYTFPQALGRSKASETILMGQQLSADEAYRLGLISKVIPHEQLELFVRNLTNQLKNLPLNSVKISKKLMTEVSKPILFECCDREVEQLLQCFESQEFLDAILKFMSKKSKL